MRSKERWIEAIEITNQLYGGYKIRAAAATLLRQIIP